MRVPGPKHRMHKLTLQGRDEDYTYHFTEHDMAELAAAVSSIKQAGVQGEKDILKVRHTTVSLMRIPLSNANRPIDHACRKVIVLDLC